MYINYVSQWNYDQFDSLIQVAISEIQINYSVTMVLFANIAYNEMRGFVMGACETIAGITRCTVSSNVIDHLLCRVL